MKKLMIMAAAAMLGVAANASVALNWSGTWIYNHNDDNLSTGVSAYLVDSSIYTKLLGDIEKGSFDTSSTGIMATTTVQDGGEDRGSYISAQPSDINAVNNSWSPEQSISLYTVFVDGDYVGISQWVADDTAVPADGNVLSAGFGELSSEDGDNYVSWYTSEPEGTPEPTSAVLMLVGLAGLALRRKRA